MLVVLAPRRIVPDPCLVFQMESNVPAGFPSPAADHAGRRIDLTEVLIEHPAATFLVRISGHSLVEAGVGDGDLAIVDRSLVPRPGDLVVAAVDGELVAKRLARRQDRTYLDPETDDPLYRPLDITGRDDVQVWGVVTATIRRHRR